MPLSRRYTPEWAPGENAILGMDFSFVIPPGIGIASGSVSFWTNTAGPTNVGTDFTIGAVQVLGRVIFCNLSGGLAGRDYQVRWIAADTDGNVWPRTALMLCGQTS
jgi:hypothetical protein